MTIATGDIAQNHSGLHKFMTRRLSSQNVSGSINESIIEDGLNFLLDLDEIHFDLDTSISLERLLSDLESLDESHLYTKQSTGLRRTLMKAYYRKHKLAILKKRQELKHTIKGKSIERKKAAMSKSDRTATGRKKKKNLPAKNHLNEKQIYEVYPDFDFTIFEKSRKTDKRAQLIDFLKPTIERARSFSERDAQIKISTLKSKRKTGIQNRQD